MPMPTRSGRVRTVLRWPLGIGLVSWRYMWRTIPLHRSDEPGSREKDLPAGDYDTSGFTERLQPLAAGTGSLLHRLYRVRIVGRGLTPEALISLVTHRLNQAAPEVAEFRKTSGRGGSMRPGDEFVVRMPGPWDGPVRVVRRDQNSFRLATLDGHLEAGEIEFRAEPAADGELRFEIDPGPGRATGCRPCCTTSSGWPRRSSSTCGRTFASGPPPCPAAARGAASASAPAG
jgi:hypothetical protein